MPEKKANKKLNQNLQSKNPTESIVLSESAGPTNCNLVVGFCGVYWSGTLSKRKGERITTWVRHASFVFFELWSSGGILSDWVFEGGFVFSFCLQEFFKKSRSGERNACGIILVVFNFGLVGMISCGSNRGWGTRMMAAVVAVVPPQAAGGVAAVVPMKEASFAPSKVQSQLVLMRHGNNQSNKRAVLYYCSCPSLVVVVLGFLFFLWFLWSSSCITYVSKFLEEDLVWTWIDHPSFLSICFALGDATKVVTFTIWRWYSLVSDVIYLHKHT